MQRAGTAAAKEIIRRFGDRLNPGAVVFVGPGNNGGDGWVVAGELARSGVSVTVDEAGEARTPDAIAERAAAIESVSLSADTIVGAVAVDALLGTGFRGVLRGEVAESIARINVAHSAGWGVASLDVPSGLDATTGQHSNCVIADLTLSFGGLKRGTLLARDCCGEIVVIDIGLDEAASNMDERLPLLIDRSWIASRLPAFRYDSHKGERKHLAIVGGGKGMPGAAALAARGALRSGIGLVRVVAASGSIAAVVAATPAALVTDWPADAAAAKREIGDWADAIVMGPGMGQTRESRNAIELVLGATRQPALLDADALNVFQNDVSALRDLLGGRPALITPHAGELARLAGTDVETVLAERFDIGSSIAAKLGATVLLKGAPTVIFTPAGERLVSPRGTAALGTGGSGDILAGIAGTLLAQTSDPLAAAGCAAWIHGRAAELCAYVRGTTLEDVLYALPRAWNDDDLPLEPPVTARLPAVER
jgi:NAD(P)H-hydrate epimerase